MNGNKLEVRVEATKERKQWLTTFFTNTRAIEKALGADYASVAISSGVSRHITSISHTLNTVPKDFMYSEDILNKTGITEEAITEHLPPNRSARGDKVNPREQRRRNAIETSNAQLSNTPPFTRPSPSRLP